MKKLQLLLIAVTMLPAASAADPAAGKAKDEDAKKLTGTWELVALVRDGKTRAIKEKDDRYREQWTFGGGQIKRGLLVNFPEGPGLLEPVAWKAIYYKIDPAKTPKTVDFTYVNNEKRNGQEVKLLLEGIYQLDGDELKIATAKELNGDEVKIENAPRPKNFDNCLVFKRVKK
jgi:uncharacterized protein (TIGR03067 family)